MKKSFSLKDLASAAKKKFLFDKSQLTKPGAIKTIKKELGDLEQKRQQEQEEKQRRKQAEEQRQLLAPDIKRQKEEEEAVMQEPLLPKQKPKRKHKTHKQLLELAGLEPDPQIIYKRLFVYTIITMMAATAVTLVMGYFYNATFVNLKALTGYIWFIAAFWTAGFAGVFMLFSVCFAVYLDLRINKRRKEIEAVFPDFLQLAAANLSAGMTIDRALWSAIRPRFGILAKEMEDVAKKTITGYDLERALHEFSDKYDSLTISRSVSLIIEAIHSGGRLADILNKIAINMQENAILQKEMAANVTTYIIFISFATILAAPFLFGLATQLLIVIKSIAGSINAQGASGAGLSINPNVVSTSDFKTFAMILLSASALMSACIVSVIRKGTVKDGFRLLPFFWFVTISIYFVATWVLGFVFSGLV